MKRGRVFEGVTPLVVSVRVRCQALRFRGAVWFHESYHFPELPWLARDNVGYRVAMASALGGQHESVMAARSESGEWFFASYEDLARFEQADDGEPAVACTETVTLAWQAPVREVVEGTAATRELLIGDHWYLATSGNVLLDWYGNKRPRLEDRETGPVRRWRVEAGLSEGAALAAFAGRTAFFEVADGSRPSLLFGVARSVDSPHVANEMVSDTGALLALCLPELSVAYDPGLLVAHFDRAERTVTVAYRDPRLVFASGADVALFWQYCQARAVTSLEARCTPLVELYAAHVGELWRRLVFLAEGGKEGYACVPVCRGSTGGPERLTCAPEVVAPVQLRRTVAERTVGIDGLRLRGSSWLPPVSLLQLVETVRQLAPRLFYVQKESFVPRPVQNRVLFGPRCIRACLVCGHAEGGAGDRNQTERAHVCSVLIDLNDRVWYCCGTERHELGRLAHAGHADPLTVNYPLAVPGDFDLELAYILEHGHVGLQHYLAQALRHRAFYDMGDDRWYYWSEQKIWVRDNAKSAHLKSYLSTKLSELFSAYQRDCGEGDAADAKRVLKSLASLAGSIRNTGAGVSHVLELLQDSLGITDLDKRSRHVGLVSAANGLVDLRTMAFAVPTADMLVTQQCEFQFAPCACEPGECFGPGCTSRYAEEMRWVDARLREIMGCDLKRYVWRTADGSEVPPPVTLRESEITEFWRTANGNEYGAPPGDEAGDAELARRSIELAFENGGTENYRRFMWALGYMITGYADRKLLIYNYGGTNGAKSLVLEALKTAFPPYLGTMPAGALFAKGGSRVNDGPTPSSVLIWKKRATIAADISVNDVFNDAMMKQWTGLDSQTIRKMRAEYQDLKPRMVPGVAANVEVKFQLFDEASWTRLFVQLFPMRFVDPHTRPPYPHGYKLNERPWCTTLKDELNKPDKLNGLFNWTIRAAHFYAHTPQAPTPRLVQEVFDRFYNSCNPLPKFLHDLQTPYTFAEHGRVSLSEFLADLKMWAQRENLQFQETDRRRFAQLLERLHEGGSLPDSVRVESTWLRGITRVE